MAPSPGFVLAMLEAYADYEDPLARLQLVLFMLGMGATLSLGDFGAVLRQPRSFLVGLAGQLFVLPWLAVALIALFRLDEGLALGLILTAAMPGGATSKLFTVLGQGNSALSISLTAVTTLLTLITVPGMLTLFGGLALALDLEAVGHIVQILLLCLLLPVLGGLAVARCWPTGRMAFARWCIRIGLVVVVTMVVGALGSGRIRPGEYGFGAPIAVILFCVLGQQLIMLPFHLLHWPRADRMAVGIEVTMRNMNLALLLKATLFPDRTSDPEAEAIARGVLYVILFYAGAAMGAGIPQVLIHRRLARKESLAS